MKVPVRIATLLLIIGIGASLTGCASPAELAAADHKDCEGFGFRPGTDEFAKCVMTKSQRREDAQAKWMAQQKASMNAMVPATTTPTQTSCKSSETTSTSGDASHSTTKSEGSSMCLSF